MTIMTMILAAVVMVTVSQAVEVRASVGGTCSAQMHFL
jgi:hypothetical protein